MKRILAGDRRDILLSTLETVLRHLGYRVLASSDPRRLEELLHGAPVDLLLLGAGLLDGDAALTRRVADRVEEGIPLVVMAGEGERVPLELPHRRLGLPLDVFELFSLVQEHLEQTPRRHLRLPLRLPGLLCLEKGEHWVELLSLSRRGMFVRTSQRLEPGREIQVVIPLLGMKRELEMAGRVLYRTHPAAENNYLEGVGVGFGTLSSEDSRALDSFIERRFLKELPAEEAPITLRPLAHHGPS